MHKLFKPFSKQDREEKDVEINGQVNGSDKGGGEVQESSLQILDPTKFSTSLWANAFARVQQDTGWQPPSEWSSEKLNLADQVKAVRQEAQDRADEAKFSERRIAGGSHTYRQVYDSVAKYAKEFQAVGDIVVQADPGYSALPWAVIRFAIQLASAESETYHRMLEGTSIVSRYISQYSVIEGTYARVDSDLSKELRNVLEGFFVTLLKYQITSMHYFDPDHKFSRAVVGLNPVSAAGLKDRRSAIDTERGQVDQCIGLVHVDVTRRGLDDIKLNTGTILVQQQEQLKIVREGILALATNEGSAFREQNKMINDQFNSLSEMWGGQLGKLQKKIEQDEIEEERRRIGEMKDWLSLAEPENDFSDAKTKRRLDLGNWLLSDATFKEWEGSSRSALMWLHGFAGTGKTGLVNRVIEHFRERSDASSDRMAFFFCSNDSAETVRTGSLSRSDPMEALRSLVSQLGISQHNRMVATPLKDKYDAFGRDKDRRRKLEETECLEILKAIADELPVTMILDGFDELDQILSSDLLLLLRKLLTECPKNVKIFISTRIFPAIENEMSTDKSIEVTAENNGEDVRTFIKTTLQNRIDEHALLNGKVPEKLQADIESTLSYRAQGMFLYAALQLDQLCDRSRINDEDSIRKKLEELPKNITEIYNDTLAAIHEDAQRASRIAQNTFKWILLSQAPLPMEALLDAISPPERKTNTDEVLQVCRKLVVQGKSAFEFAHYSVREHLSNMTEYSASRCDVVITQGCLDTLNSSFGLQGVTLSEAQKVFLNYALLYWPFHYEGISGRDLEDNKASINGSLRNFLLQGRSKTNKYAQWFDQAQKMAADLANAKYLTDKLKQLRSDPLSPLFAACVFGHEDVIGKFGRELDGLNQQNSYGQTALCLAISNQKLAVVKALLSKRFPADINLLNVKAVEQFEEFDHKKRPEVIIYASAVQCAAAVGGMEILKYLVEEGANVDLVAGYYGSPLQAAAHNGRTDIVAFLLARGAEPNSQGGFHGNALQAAAAHGHNDVLTLLMENKPPALIGAPGGYHGSALMAAVSSGNSDTVWALLEEKADPNVRTKDKASLLENAAKMGFAYSDIVSLLLENGAEADLSPKGNAVHLLHRAAMNNQLDLARHCLDRGCRIDMVTTEQPAHQERLREFPSELTPLGYACAAGHVSMVEFLLSRGAPLEIGKPKSALLWTAAYQGHAEIARLLITHCKNTQPGQLGRFFDQLPESNSKFPLVCAAASSGNRQVVEVLLDAGAAYKDSAYRATPLQVAAIHGAGEVAKCFLEYHNERRIDARLDQKDVNGKNALLEAYAKNRPRIGRLLLQAGADYAVFDNGIASCFHLSTMHNSPGMVIELMNKALEDKEKDPDRFFKLLNLRHSSGKTALLDSADRNRPVTLNLLLKHGADFTIPGGAGRTPLHWACSHGYVDLARAILDKAKETYKDEPDRYNAFINFQTFKEGDTALRIAVNDRRMKVIELLLDCGADFSIPNKNRTSVLNHACWQGFKEEVELLLQRASTNASSDEFQKFLDHLNGQGKTALIDATENGKIEIARLLLEKYNPDYTLFTNAGITALHHASYKGFPDVVELLLKKASSDPDKQRFSNFLNRKRDQGRTALLDAAEMNRPGIMNMLLEHNADWSVANDNNFTALHFCAVRDHKECVDILVKHVMRKRDEDHQKFYTFLNRAGKGNRATAIRDVASRNYAHLVAVLLPLDPDLEIVDNSGRHALHYAIQNRNDNMFVIIMGHLRKKGDGALINRLVIEMKDGTGMSVAVGVAQQRNQRMLEALSACGIFIELN